MPSCPYHNPGPAKTAAQVVQCLDPLQQPLRELQSGALAGDWEAALELVGRVIEALRQVSRHAAALWGAEHFLAVPQNHRAMLGERLQC